MKALVLGYGSIGSRHARLLAELGCATSVVSARQVDHADVLPSLARGLAERDPAYVVVANATSGHGDAVRELAALGFGGTVLVEKPLLAQPQPLPALLFRQLAVAYNLRFHPLLQRLREQLEGERVLAVQCYVGQYLPGWRPQADYRESYSAHAAQGGGVLRDLSHELDYLSWLFGPWQRVCALGGHYSSLHGDSDDTFGLMLAHERCPLVQLQMNYTDRVGRRRLLVNTDRVTIELDLVAGRFSVDGQSETVAVERDHTYREMHKALLAGEPAALCSLPQALDTVALIDAAERSSRTGTWISA